MIGLDTNVVIRYLVQDDEAQARAAETLIDGLTEDEPGYISVVVLSEIVWVLTRAYRVPAAELAPIIEGLLTAAELRVQAPSVVLRAAREARDTGADFADALIAGLAADAGCASTVTFDRAAARLPGMSLLSV